MHIHIYMPLYLSDPVLLCVCVVMSNSSGNTVPTCFWVFYYILRTPQLVEDLRKEVNKVCGGTDGKVDVLFTQVPYVFHIHVVMLIIYSYHTAIHSSHIISPSYNPTSFTQVPHLFHTPCCYELHHNTSLFCNESHIITSHLINPHQPYIIYVSGPIEQYTPVSVRCMCHCLSPNNPTSSPPMFVYNVMTYQDQLNNMHLLDACVTESMRLASGSLVMRFVQRPCSITLNSGNTYHFRKGDRVGIAPPITHHDSEV